METYHKIQTLFKRDLDGSLTGKKGKMIEGSWTTPELEYLAGNEWEFTEKVDGTNIRIGLNKTGFNDSTVNVEYGGRSNNAAIPGPLLHFLEATFPTFPSWRRDVSADPYIGRYRELVKWMQESNLEKVILFGEGYGNKIQNGGNYRDDQSFVLFDVKIGDWWLHRKDVNDIATKLGIDSVPVIGRGTLYEGINMVKGDRMSLRASLRSFVKENQGLFSLWGDFEAEGIVARPKVPMFDRKGQRIITKIKAVDFDD
jgi:hypothetical protein